MDFVLTPESLQNIAIKCVTSFVTKQASLSEAIADESKSLELNPEQIKRVIETSNTLAYLRLLKDSPDRTFEFPIAEYPKVLANMSMPNVEKCASSKSDSNLEKKAEVEVEIGEEINSMSTQEKRSILQKQAMINKQILSQIGEDKEYLKICLEKAAGVLTKDELGLEKLAQVVPEEDFTKICKLCAIEKRAEIGSIFVDKDLESAKQVYSLYTEAKELLEKEASLITFVKRAEEILFQKKSSFDPLGGATEGFAKGTSWAASKTVGGLGKTIGKIRPGEFAGNARKMGFKNTDEAVKHFDKIRGTKGVEAAKAHFSGAKPSTLFHRVGISGAATAASGLDIKHDVNVWKDLQG